MASTLQSSNMQHDVVNALADTVGNLKISTLVNAAKISPLVQERTIGPKHTNGLHKNQTDHKIESVDNRCERSSVANSSKNSLQNGIFDGSKFRKDVWREVNIESEHEETPKNVLQLNDCKAISFRLAANTAEKQRRAKISTHLQEKQCQWDSELEQRLQQIRIDSAEKQKQNNAKRLERERITLQAIEKIEAQAKQDEMKSNLKKSEMIEHSRKLIEHANQLKRQDEIRLLFESINASKLLFINLHELFAKIIINHQALLNQIGKLEELVGKRDGFLERYEKIINTVNSKPITITDTELFEKLCLDIKKEQSDLNSLIQSSKEALSQNAAIDASKVANNLQVKNNETTTFKSPAETLRTANTNEVSVTDGNTAKLSNPAMISSNKNIGSGVHISKYHELMRFYQEYKAQVQPLLADVNMKQFRFNCKKGVSTPVNAISPINVQHLQEKFEKIADLLAGRHVEVNSGTFSASEHPLGIKYCTYLLAEKFIAQGTTVTSSNPQASFSIAAILVSIWQLYPDVGNLFLAILYSNCPFFVPYLIAQQPGQDDNEYFSILGYKFTNDGKIEDQQEYLKRLSGLQRLYSAVLITKLKRSQQHLEHPHGIENAWLWLSNYLMLDPLPGISEVLVLEFIQICGAEMWQVYKKQFMKLLVVLHDQYIPRLEVLMVNMQIDSGGPFSRLKDLIGTIVRENRITQPKGILPPNFW